MKKFINVDGNTACSKIAYYLSEVAEIYPITPSSAMAENCDEWAGQNKKNIFGQTLLIKEMQSEAGAAGALHGSLSSGALSTTFTASQGLLLMLPNMFKIAGEMLPTVFHVSARAVATHALSIFGDHSDVMAVRSSGFNILCSNNVQEAQDLALVSHIASLNTSLPFLHFFDGFRTSHEVQKIESIPEKDIDKIFPFDKVKEFKFRALNPNSPTQKGTAQNPDIFFQNREACNSAYSNVYAEVKNAMKLVENITGRHYAPYEFYGSSRAKFVIVMMGSGSETAEETLDFFNQNGESLGLVKVRLFSPFNMAEFVKVLPKSVAKIAVLDRAKETNGVGEPLFQLISSSILQSGRKIKVIGGRYGLGGKEFTPRQVKAVYENLKSKTPIENFSVGVVDDVTRKSLTLENFELTEENVYEMKFYGLGSDGTVGANKNSIKIIGEETDKFTQGYFEYDSKKSGSITISHLRISDKKIKSTYTTRHPNFIAIHNYSFVARYNLLENLSNNGVVLLNTVLNEGELSRDLPYKFVQDLKKKNAKLFIIDGNKIAGENGLGNKINVIMQGAFFKLSKIIDEKIIFEKLKIAVEKTYGRKGDKVVQKNISALKSSFDKIVEVDVGKLAGREFKPSKMTTDKYFREIIEPINKLEGNNLPVSAFSPDGVVPTDTTKFEKRGIGEHCPNWNSEKCVQCGLCSLACPHGAISASLLKDGDLKNKPSTLVTKNALGANGCQFRLQVSPLDCTGCGVCASVCPTRALEMKLTTEILDNERKNINFLKKVKKLPNNFPEDLPRYLQFCEPYFKYNYACAGCGETPYIKLATTLFGKNMIIANATGCSSIYGGSAPSCPYSKDENGNGPAWANSLFEDNAEFGLGIKLGINIEKNKLKNNINNLIINYEEINKNNINNSILIKNNKKIIKKLKNYLKNENNLKNNEIDELIFELTEQLKNNIFVDKKLIKNILENKNNLYKKSVWLVGGDGWAYDIGFGGVDHILSSNEDVNILVLDTEVYSNTGGQSSKSTPSGTYAKFASNGKNTPKKDLGAIAMNYPNAYVASVSLGASPTQTISVFKEAERHTGPSIIIAYAPCINHGINMSNSNLEMKKAVETGYWFLYRRRPENFTENSAEEFILDSVPSKNYQEFLAGETRFTSLLKTNPRLAEKLFKQSEIDAQKRLNKLKNKIKSEK